MPGGSQVMLVVPEQVVQEAGDILALAGNTNTNTDWVKHHTIQHTLLQCFIISELSESNLVF